VFPATIRPRRLTVFDAELVMMQWLSVPPTLLALADEVIE
jgi:hypothetical protein